MGEDPTGNTEALLLLVWMVAMVLVVVPSGEVT